MALRIVFCGTPAFGLPSLKLLLAETDFSVEAVVTQPDRPRLRGLESASSPIKDAGLAAGVHIYQPEKIRSDSAHDFFKHLAPDAVVIIAYGQIIPNGLIEIPRLGWINLHASLLPKYRGAAPIQRAILNGERKTGVTTMQIDAGLDTGPLLEQVELDIGADETSPQLSSRMAEAGAPLMLDTLRKLSRGELQPKPQDNSLASLAPPLKKSDGLIDWTKPAASIYNQIRAFDPWPGAYARFRGQTCHIWGHPILQSNATIGRPDSGTIIVERESVLVACGAATGLRLDFVQAEGRKRVTAHEFANGARFKPGEKFTS